MSDKTIKLVLVGEDKSASKTLKGVGDEAEKAGGKLDGMSVLGAAALAATAAAVVEFGKSSVAAYRDAEKSQRELEDAYTRFPSVADVPIEKLRELNSAIQAKTGADADDLASSQAVMAQYGLTGQQIADLTPLLDDYAVKTGKDLPSAAEDLGKAMLGQGRALKNVGIDFVDAGSTGANFNQVMAGLRTQVGGFASSESTSAEGALRRLNTEFGDVQEEVGSQLLPVLVQLGEGLLGTIGWIEENTDILGPLAVAVGVAAVMLAAMNVQQGIMAAGGLVNFIKAWAAEQAILNLVMSMNPIALVVIAIAALVAGFIVAYNTSEDFRRIVDGALNAVMDTGKSVANWFNTDLPAFFVTAANSIGSAFAVVKDFILAPIRDAVAWINETFVNGINGFLGTIGVSWQVPTIPGFAAGGYTGPGGKFQPAGIVHAGEVVWSQDDVAAWGGPLAVDSMRQARGFASGGIVPNAAGWGGVDPAFLSALQAWASASGYSGGVTGAGGFRSYDQQAALYASYLAGTGNLAAKPGTSAHESGRALDINPWPSSAQAAMLAQFGLGQTVGGEPWHIAMLGGGSGAGGSFDFGLGALLDGLMGSLPSIPSPWGEVISAVLDKTVGGLVDKVTGFLGSMFGVGGGSAGGGDVKALAQQMAAERGWTGSQWAAIDWIVSKESGWNPNAQNPTSTAYGLFQFLNSTWATVGAGKTADPAGQISAGLQYIAQRYGTPVGAQGFWQNNGWYDSGGWAMPGYTGVMNGTGKPEAILTSEQWRDVSAAATSGGIDKDALREAVVAGVREGMSGAELRLTGAVDTIGDAVAGRIMLAYEGAV